MKIKYNFINKIVELRKKKGMTQIELAEITKLDQAVISRFEKGTSNPTLNTLLRILDALEHEICLGNKKVEYEDGEVIKLDHKVKILDAFFKNFRTRKNEIDFEYHELRNSYHLMENTSIFEKICDDIMLQIIDFYHFNIDEEDNG